jgi:hypothetical protein
MPTLKIETRNAFGETLGLHLEALIVATGLAFTGFTINAQGTAPRLRENAAQA